MTMTSPDPMTTATAEMFMRQRDEASRQCVRLQAALDEAVELMRTARGHYGIEECARPGQPATDWDDLQNEMRMFVWQWGDGTDG